MKTVILDGYTINPGDLSWDVFRQFGDLEVYHRTKPDEAFDRAKDADVIITSKVVCDRPLLQRLPRLRFIAVIATGYNVVDLQYTRERNIAVSNVPNYCTASVAQMVFAHTLNLCRRVAYHAQAASQGKWSDAQDFCYWDLPQIDLAGKTLGLIGCGNIGRAVARIAQAMDMRVIGYDPYAHELTGIRRVDLNTVFGTSDVVSLHCPLTDETQGVINMANIKKMKRTAFLINTSRGPLINETDLAKALEEGLIAGAGLDVLSSEPPPMDNPLLSARNCFLTPHIAWASQEARAYLIELTANNVRSYLSGKPTNVVNGL